MKRLTLILAVFIFAVSRFGQKPDLADELRSLVEAERAFARTSVEKGMREAFLSFLADDSVMFRPNPVNGKQWWRERPATNALLTWQPTFADVSSAGDLGYTFGPSEYRHNGPDDKSVWYGHFVSVWKKQADGTWKVKVDLGTSNPAPTTNATLELPADFKKRAHPASSKVDLEAEQASLLSLDREFSSASIGQGSLKAFMSYAADGLRFFRANSFPLIGKQAVRQVLSEKPGLVNWEPIKAEVSKAGDLGYTYGTYSFEGNTQGSKSAENGHYVRIWRKQADGKWKVVVDIFNPIPKPATAQ